MASSDIGVQRKDILAVAACEFIFALDRTIASAVPDLLTVDTFDLNFIRVFHMLFRTGASSVSELCGTLAINCKEVCIHSLPSQRAHFGMPRSMGMPASFKR